MKTDDATGMIGTCLGGTGVNLSVLHGSSISKRLIELQYKVVLEIAWHTTTVLGGVAYDFLFSRNDFHKRAIVHGIDHHIGFLRFRESETEGSGTLGRSKLRRHIMVGKIDLIIIRSGSLGFVRKPTGTPVLVESHLSGNGHNGKLSVVVNPRAGLVCLLEAANLVGIIGVCPSVTHGSGLWSPEIHAPRHSHGRISITRRKGMLGLRANQGADVIHRCNRLINRQRGRLHTAYKKEGGSPCKESFHSFGKFCHCLFCINLPSSIFM